MLDEVEFELVLDSRANLGEGPVWDAQTSTLVWVDMMAHDVHRFDPATGKDTAVNVGTPVGAAVLRASGGMMLAVEDGFLALSDAGEVELFAAVEAQDRTHRMNDGKCDSAGRFWAGTTSYDFVPGESTLWRLDADGATTPVITGMTLSNGLGWSPDDRTLYVIDSFGLRLDAFDYDASSGTVGPARQLIGFADGGALPDGMTVDAEGYLWVAMYGGGALRRYAPDGSLDREVPVPVSQPTSCAFGGPDYTDLYVTTANQLTTPEQRAAEPTLGGLFRCRPGVAGLPASRFAG